MSAATVSDDRHDILRSRIGLMCRVIRAAALIWFVWAAIRSISNWLSLSAVKDSWGRYLHLDLNGLPFSHHMTAFAVVLVDLTLAGVVVVFLWRLFGCYLRGSIFAIGISIEDYMVIIFGGLVLAIGHVLIAAASLADDHRQII